MERYKTYIRLKRTSVLNYILRYVCICIGTLIVLKLLLPLMYSKEEPLLDTIFGVQLISNFMFIVFIPINLLFALLFNNHFQKYRKEINEGLIPIYKDSPLWQPQKMNGEECEWINNYEFNTTIELLSDPPEEMACGCGLSFYGVKDLLTDNEYLLNSKDLIFYFSKFKDRKLMGTFTFQRYNTTFYLKVLEVK